MRTKLSASMLARPSRKKTLKSTICRRTSIKVVHPSESVSADRFELGGCHGYQIIHKDFSLMDVLSCLDLSLHIFCGVNSSAHTSQCDIDKTFCACPPPPPTPPTPSVCFTVNICRSRLWISVWRQHDKPADAQLAPSVCVCASSQQHLRSYQTKHKSLRVIQALDT